MRVVKAFSNVGVDDMLDYVGLERRRSHGWEKLAMFGVGAVAGAGAGLLLAPASGRETRQKLGKTMDDLASKATEALAEAKQHERELLGQVTGHASKGDDNLQHHDAGGNQGR